MALSSRSRRVAVIAATVALLGGGWGVRVVLARRAEMERLRAAFVSFDGGESRAIEPTVAVNARNDVAIAWMRIPEREDEVDDKGGEAGEAADAIGVRLGAGGGARLGAIDAVRSPGGRFAADPVLTTLSDGAFVLSWLAFRVNLKAHGDAYDMRVYAARAEPGAQRFAAPVLVTSDEPEHEYDRPWSTVTSRGRLVVAYRAAARGSAGIAVATSDDGARTFRRRDLFSRFDFVGGLVTTCAGAGSTNVYVAYLDPLAGIVLRPSHDDGESFPDAEAQTISAQGENVALEAPSCVASGDEVIVSYGIGAGPMNTGTSAILTHVALARSRDGGRTFDARTSVSEPGHVLVHPRLAPLGKGKLAIVTYAIAGSANDATTGTARSGELRVFRAELGTNANGAVLRGDLRVAPRRDDPAWGGDYLGLWTASDRIFAAYVDVADGRPQVAFFTTP